MKSFFKRWNTTLITLLLSIIIVIVIFCLQKVAPFGKNSLLTIDFFHQYGPMLGELYDRILSKSSLIYSFSMGMGLPFFRNFFNYLSSPFNILLFLFKHKDLLMSYSVIIGLKAAVSACTMNYYLKEKFGKSFLFIALSILYAFSAYFTAYYWNIMWLDGMVLLPLIILGIENIVNKNKYLLYIISLSLMIFSNYFIGYMTCIFSVLYFISYLIIKTDKFDIKKVLKKVLSFIIYSLIAGGLCAFFLISMYYALKEISATGDVFPTSQYYAFTLQEFIFNHFTGIGSTVLKSGITSAPNISCGVLSVALLILFWCNSSIKLKTKIVYTSLLAFLALSFIIGPIDYIWHAFHVPNDLPYRYSFIYSFVLTIISAYSIYHINKIKPIYPLITYFIMLILITLMKLTNYVNITSDMLIVNYILITVYYLCYVIYKYFNKYKKIAVIVLIITSLLEVVMVVNNNWSIDQNIKGFYEDYNSVKESIGFIKDNDTDMYRLEKTDMLTFNDPSWYGYYGQVTFSSMEYENMAVLNYRLGAPGNEINSYYYKDNTPIYNLMFNIKYLVGDTNNNSFSLYYTNDDLNIYKNNYNIGLMYGVNKNLETWKNNFQNPFKNQNNFIYNATGIDNILEKINIYKEEVVYNNDDQIIVKYTIKNPKNNYYFYLNNLDFALIDHNIYYINDDYNYVDVLNIDIYNYYNYNEKYIISKVSDKDYIDFYIGYSTYLPSLEIYTINKDKLDKVYNYLINNKVIINNFNEHYIEGSIDANEDMLIYTSIPYDKGWNVYVDNKKQDIKVIGNSLIGFDISKGEHEIVLKYHIPYIKIGLLISLLSLGSLIVLKKIKH